MANYKTPGVYIEEISTLPASVAPVATAVPAFIGYTEKAIVDNVSIDPSTDRIPVRITSMLDFIEHFGGPFQEHYTATLADPLAGETDPQITIQSLGVVPLQSPYKLYYQMKMFYANGGGVCYVVSVGEYFDVDVDDDPSTFPVNGDIPTAATNIDSTALNDGLAVCEEIDEITILTVPEAILLSDLNRKTLYDNMLIQCNKLQDRFAVLDVEADTLSTVFDDGNDFRNDNIGPDFLKYGAAYYPSLETLIEFSFNDSSIRIDDNTALGIWDTQRLGAIVTGQDFGGTDIPLNATVTVTLDALNIVAAGDTIQIGPVTLTAVVGAPAANEFEIGASANGTAQNLGAEINGLATTGVTSSRVANVLTLTAIVDGSLGNSIAVVYTPVGASIGIILSGDLLSGGVDQYVDTNLYNRIKKEIQKHKVTLYPCGAVAGIYASVDRDRGVWKAPANVSVSLTKAPTISVTSAEQEDLNVDATTGKSINAIRAFHGKGNIVWGARTLAGNDNEWRYVPVRRFFNFMEESIKKATEFVVFEPNSKPTWVRTKGMIDNFLSQLWREGALAGAKPEHAFFVKVGLGETMTALDILEGRMNIEIGVAAVRPAEFIILKFSHKLQES